MPAKTLCKIVRQYNKVPVSKEDMQKLLEIAQDYASVKNHVHQRYGGVNSLPKLYPGYTIQNEMTRSGLRERLGMPSVYFYLAVFDAIREIKIQWTGVKTAVLKQVNAHEGLTEEEKHFLRYALKISNVFVSIVTDTPLKLAREFQMKYDALAGSVDAKKLKNYLRRQVRRRSRKLHVEAVEGFSVTERAYRYGDQGIYISVKQKRKRIFIPLTDSNRYKRQMYLRLFPEENAVELCIPVDIAVRHHQDYDREVGLSMGMAVMLVTDEGHVYGEQFQAYQEELSQWLQEQTGRYHRNREANPGRKKYYAKKHRLEEQLHSYINQELNRFFREEKPARVFLPKLPKTGVSGPVRGINYLTSTWQRGYVKRRLVQKCKEQSVEFTEVFGKGISLECSACGGAGSIKDDRFFCSHCGYEAERKMNAAKNARKRGQKAQALCSADSHVFTEQKNTADISQIIKTQILDK